MALMTQVFTFTTTPQEDRLTFLSKFASSTDFIIEMPDYICHLVIECVTKDIDTTLIFTARMKTVREPNGKIIEENGTTMYKGYLNGLTGKGEIRLIPNSQLTLIPYW
jgi:hypothetical protein